MTAARWVDRGAQRRGTASAEDGPGGRAALVAMAALVATGLLGAQVYAPFSAPWGAALAILLDAMVGFCLVTCLLGLQRPNALGFGLSIAVPCLLLAASWGKLAVLGTPATIGDIALLPDLARTLPGWGVALAGAALGLLAIGLLLNFQLQRRAAVGMAPALAVAAGLLFVELSPTAARMAATHLPLRLSDLPVFGHALEAGWAQVEAAVQRDAVQDALAAGDAATPPPPPLPPLERRNLHIVVLESFIDPLSFPRFPWPAEPLSPLFGRWRGEAAASVASQALVPVFGARSSNTEFELLCGVPATGGPSDVVFLRIEAGSRLACLPALLAEHGFDRMALVPNSPRFFGAANAYAAFGIARSVFGPDLDMTDLDGTWLSAASTLAQARALFDAARRRDPATPMLSYVFVNAAHHPFARNTALRPDRLTPAPSDPVVRNWANAAHHTALAVEEHVALIQAADPEALIVVVGDHAPPLGPNLRGYRAGRDAEGSPPLLQRAEMYATPLLVLDRGRLVQAGRLPAWQLPGLLIDILSGSRFCADHACPHEAEWRVRPFFDLAIAVEAQGPGEILCRDQHRDEPRAEACAAVLAEARRLRVAATRLLMGQDVIARRDTAAAPARP